MARGFLVFLACIIMAPALGAGLPRHAVLGAGVENKDGIRVTLVRPDSPAARAGLAVGDVLLAVGAAKVESPAQFVRLVQQSPAGRRTTFRIRRAGAEMALNTVLDAAPDERDPLVTTLYQSVEVNGSLRRTLVTVPLHARGRLPAVLFVGGIGCYSIDNAANPEDAYMRLAHDLGRRGIVAMRLEKSGVGDSQGPACASVDFVQEMGSYAVALEALRRDRRVDPARIYLFGHSIGTLIAPRLSQNAPVAGAIVAEGLARNWIEYELENTRRQSELDGEKPAAVDAAIALKEFCIHRLLVDKQAEEEIERAQPGCREHNTYPAPAAYLQQVAALNMAEPWTSYSKPVLAIYGTADWVTSEVDHRRIVDIVNAAHPGSAELRVIDGMDHFLDVGGTPQQDYDRVKKGGAGAYDERFSAAVLDWLCRRETCMADASAR